MIFRLCGMRSAEMLRYPRDFCILDSAGEVHSLVRRIDGVKAADLREKMKDIDRERLPGVATVRSRPWRQARADLKAAKLVEKQEQKHDTMSFKEGARNKPEPKTLEPYDDTKSVKVMLSGVGKVAEKLTRYVEEIIDLFDPSPRRITYEDYLKSDAARKEYFEQKAQEEKREQALANISRDMRTGKHRAASDIHNLNRSDLEQIKHNGDDGIKALIEAFEREQKRQRENQIGGRQRER